MAKLSENVKNMRQHVGKIFGKKQAKSIGTYQEAPGGGTAVDGGGRGAMKKNFKVVNSKEEADAIREENPRAVIRYNQPRDEDGRFTYNSANGKELVEGPSRGVTVPPFLRGAKIVFATKKNKAVVHDNTTWNFQIQMEAADLVKMFQDILGAKSAAELLERKKGRKSNKEKEALKKKQQGFANAEIEVTGYTIREFKQKCDRALEKGRKNKPKFAEKEEQPENEPTVEPKQEEKVVSNKFDVNLAKTNREEFKKQHKETLNELAQAMKGIPEDEIVNIIAEEEITDKEELINLYNIAIKGAQ